MKGSKLSDGRVIDHLSVGDQFMGVPLSSKLKYRCVVEVTAPIETHGSHGAAWEAHREHLEHNHELHTINRFWLLLGGIQLLVCTNKIKHLGA